MNTCPMKDRNWSILSAKRHLRACEAADVLHRIRDAQEHAGAPERAQQNQSDEAGPQRVFDNLARLFAAALRQQRQRRAGYHRTRRAKHQQLVPSPILHDAVQAQ